MTSGDITVDEYERLFQVAAGVGIRRLKLTGGEPTLHPEIGRIVAAGARWFEEVSMTTNGLRLEAMAPNLADAGLSRVNVSLDTLNRNRYRELTGVDGLERVRRGVRAARRAGLAPVKLNMVVLAGVNEDEIDAMQQFSAAEGVHLQLIELHTDRTNAARIDFAGGFVSLAPVEQRLGAQAVHVEAAPQHGRRRYYLGHANDRADLEDAAARPENIDESDSFVEVVRPYDNPAFCGECHRLRITGDGKLKPCLMRFDNYVDVLSVLRAGGSPDDLRQRFLEANRRRAPYWTPGKRAEPVPLRSLPRLPVVS